MKQIVIGLLCYDQGRPLSVEVFKGNTIDLSTVCSQQKILDALNIKLPKYGLVRKKTSTHHYSSV